MGKIVYHPCIHYKDMKYIYDGTIYAGYCIRPGASSYNFL